VRPPFKKTKVLITVMNYPHPSRSHQELVCTAGISEEGDWVRLYPVDYRYRPNHQQFKKYQWIELGLAPRGALWLETTTGKAASLIWTPLRFLARRYQLQTIGPSGGRLSTRFRALRGSSWKSGLNPKDLVGNRAANANLGP